MTKLQILIAIILIGIVVFLATACETVGEDERIVYDHERGIEYLIRGE